MSHFRMALSGSFDRPFDTIPIIFAVVAVALIVIMARRLRRQTTAERAARTETERQLRYTHSLQQLTATLSRARTPDEVLAACLPELLHVVEAPAGAIALLSEDRRTCDIVRSAGYDDQTLERGYTRPTSSISVIAEAIRRRELTVVDVREGRAADSCARAHDELLAAYPGAIAIPLVASARGIGAVAISLDHARAVGSDEREFLLSAGRHIGQALDRARLYTSAERARTEAEAYRARADAALQDRQAVEEALRLSETKYRSLAARTSRLYSLSSGLSEAVRPTELARVMVTRGKLVVGASAGSVAMVARDGRFEVLYGEEFAGDSPNPASMAAEPGLCATAATTTRQPIFISSFEEWQEKYPRSASIAADGGYASAAVLPLLADSTVIGVLSFHFTAPVNFDEEFRALLTSVAQHCAQALDRARLYEEAEGARAQAEAANRSKDDFLSTISHELRTPLTAILGWAAMLKNGTISPAKTQRGLDAIYNNATRQGRLIEELLDVSRIVAGRASLDLQVVDVAENLRGAVEAIMPAAASKGVEVRMEGGDTSEMAGDWAQVIGDPRRLEQVFLNLLSNAVKFTPAGGHVVISVASTPESTTVRVSDSGTGIDATFLPHVFERFRQADTTTTRSVGGLGLGLFIARHLIEAQNGTIRADSAGPDQGATFTVVLPAAHSAPMAARTGTLASGASQARSFDTRRTLDGVRVLLVDDEPDAREMMTSALETFGATVLAAASAREALHTLARATVDVVLADLAMPERDGYELIKEIRSASTARIAALPAAAVTACVRDDERDRALAAGFQMHLAKPVHPAALASAVTTLLRSGAAL